MGDLISRSALLAAYDREHTESPGRARKLIEEAPDAFWVHTPILIDYGPNRASWMCGKCRTIVHGSELVCKGCLSEIDWDNAPQGMPQMKRRECKMTTYKFEVAAKNEIIKVASEQFNEAYDISDINAVWMVHLLGSKKGIFIDSGKNNRMYEVTYNKDKDEMYIDVYEKKMNIAVPAEAFDFEVTR